MPLTSLEDIETTLRNPAFDSYRAFLDNESPGSAAAAKQFYEIIDQIEHKKFSFQLANCRTQAWFVRNVDTGKVRIAAKQCRLRWCYHCSEARQQFVTHQILPWLHGAKLPKLLTLTLQHNNNPLKQQIKKLYSSFIKLRSTALWKDRCYGGVWFFQITYSAKTEQWHPHLHVILNSEFLPHDWLEEKWIRFSGGSNIVHIKAIHDIENCLSHNARYCARPSALEKIPKLLWPDLYQAFNGRRLCGTFGNAKDVTLRPQKPEDVTKWKKIGDFSTVRQMLRTSDEALQIWNAWQFGSELPEDVDMYEFDSFLHGKDDEEPPPKELDLEPYFNFIENTWTI